MQKNLYRYYRIFAIVFILTVVGLFFTLNHTYDDAVQMIVTQFNNQQHLTAKQTSLGIQKNMAYLLSNAIKFMDKPKGIIRICGTDEREYWKFSVSDNGPGIEKEYFEKIFQMFQTLKSSERQESTGVGLTLVKKIVAMYGGEVWVESEVGKGSTFFFTFPQHKDDARNFE